MKPFGLNTEETYRAECVITRFLTVLLVYIIAESIKSGFVIVTFLLFL